MRCREDEDRAFDHRLWAAIERTRLLRGANAFLYSITEGEREILGNLYRRYYRRG